MQVLFVLPYVPSAIRTRPYNLIKALAARHDVSVLALGSRRDLADADCLRAWCRRVEVVPFRLSVGLRSCLEGALAGQPLQAAICRAPALLDRLRDLLCTERFDVVHVEHLRAAHVRAAIPDKVPAVFDAVDCISLLLERTRRFSHSPLQRLLAAVELERTRRYEAALLDQYDAVTVTSAEDARALGRLAPNAPIEVIPNGVDLEYFQPRPIPREPTTLVLSGKMSYHANVTAARFFVRDVLPGIRRRRPDVHLRIVGSRPPRAIRRLAQDPAISVTGHLPDIRDAVGSASIAICPVTVKVGIQNKILEAMALGLPVVSTREGIEGLAAVPGRDLFVANGPDEFAEQVCALLDSPARQGEVGLAGRRFVETNHRWSTAASALESAYRRAIGRHAPSQRQQHLPIGA